MTAPDTDTLAGLLPCPFCGGHAEVRTNGDWTKSIWCLSCQAICGGGTLEYASQRWNTRAPDPHITDLEARLAAAEAGEDALAEALRPFGFFSDEPNTTQQAWEIRYCDRFEDWIDFGDMESARDALAAYEARRMG